jgi:hypothetical protein
VTEPAAARYVARENTPTFEWHVVDTDSEEVAASYTFEISDRAHLCAGVVHGANGARNAATTSRAATTRDLRVQHHLLCLFEPSPPGPCRAQYGPELRHD